MLQPLHQRGYVRFRPKRQSAVCRPCERNHKRLAELHQFMDQRAPGWKSHILHERQQKNVKIAPIGERVACGFARKDGILLTGAWVESEHILSDAAVEASRTTAEHIRKMPLQQ